MAQLSTRLLLVEDNKGDARLLQAILDEIPAAWEVDFPLTHVERLSQALESLKTGGFDLVLLDLSLPDSTGLDTLARLRTAALELPIVIMTGLDSEEVAVEALRQGAQDYLVKGQVDAVGLVRAIRYAIERKGVELRIERARKRQEALREINLAITSTLDLQSVLNIVVQKVSDFFPQYASMVQLLNPQKDALEALATRNVDVSAWQQTRSGDDKGFNRITVKQKKPLIIRDIQNDPRARRPEFLRQNGFVSYLGLPLIVKDEAVGVLAMFAKEKDAFNDADIQFLATLASQAALAIDNSRLYRDIKIAGERQAALYEINRALTSTLDLKPTLEALLEKIVALSPHYAAFIRLLNRETSALEAVVCRNLDEADWRDAVGNLGQGLTQAVVLAGAPVVVADLSNDPRVRHPEYHRRNGLASFLGLPLVGEEMFLGVLGIYSRELHEFPHDEIEFFDTLAGQAAIAIHNSQLYEMLKLSNETLEKTLEVKSVLAGVMAHELKTPIQLIMGESQMLAAGVFGELAEEQRERVGKIEKGVEELHQLIDDALEMTRLEQGKVKPVVGEVAVDGLLADLKDEFNQAYSQKGVGLEFAAAVSGLVIKTDRVKLKEVLRNLLENARKFTREGKVRVEVAANDDKIVEFVVSDTGVGIKEELLPKIFDLFYQVDGSMKERGSAGMGLNIVKRMVGVLSGQIHVDSVVGKGTTFRVVLPREIA